jgi:hypothetical protein
MLNYLDQLELYLGRRCRFNKWEPNTFGMHTPMSLEEAERTYGRGRIKRAFTYKALNKLFKVVLLT